MTTGVLAGQTFATLPSSRPKHAKTLKLLP